MRDTITNAGLVTDIGWAGCRKFGEELCGDQVVIHDRRGASPVAVLADGLGSGVKACILATLTAKIIATMIAKAMPLEECVATVAATLPVCEERNIAYATFTIIRVTANREAEVIQYDNPGLILLRDGKRLEYPATAVEMGGKSILMSRFPVREGDALVAISDGALHAGTGDILNYAWDREAVIRYLEETHASRLPAKSLCTVLRDQCRRLYEGRPSDDATVCAVAVRRRFPVHVLIGPAKNKDDDPAMLAEYLARQGARIVCGGTTAQIAARHLHTEIHEDMACPDPEIPPVSFITGIDLVTEGALTIERVCRYAEDYCDDNMLYDDWCFGEDGASRMARFLLDEATDVTFTVGCAVNPAHRQPGLPQGLAAKANTIERLARALEKSGKTVTVSYW